MDYSDISFERLRQSGVQRLKRRSYPDYDSDVKLPKCPHCPDFKAVEDTFVDDAALLRLQRELLVFFSESNYIEGEASIVFISLVGISLEVGHFVDGPCLAIFELFKELVTFSQKCRTILLNLFQ